MSEHPGEPGAPVPVAAPPAGHTGAPPLPVPTLSPPGEPAELLRRRRIRHDIRHEIATIMLLARTVTDAADVGPDSRTWLGRLLAETRRLDELVRLDAGADEAVPAGPVRVDLVIGETIAVGAVTGPRVSFAATEAWARVDRLALWRAVRNLLDNACRAAGPDGTVRVRVTDEDGDAIVTVADDGPGFGAGPAGTERLGLGIVRDLAGRYGGSVRIDRGELGGCRVTLRLPAEVLR